MLTPDQGMSKVPRTIARPLRLTRLPREIRVVCFNEYTGRVVYAQNLDDPTLDRSYDYDHLGRTVRVPVKDSHADIALNGVAANRIHARRWRN